MPLAQFSQRAKVLLGEEQRRANPDNALIGLLCDAVRLARENARLGGGEAALSFSSWTCRVVEREDDMLLVLRGPSFQGAAFNAPKDSVRGEILRQFSAENELFQARVKTWMLKCHGPEITDDIIQRNQRFLEESLELVQSQGCSISEAHQIVDYVYGRPIGETFQEVGGVMVTLAALCETAEVDMLDAAEKELARVWTKIDQIRKKQAAKPVFRVSGSVTDPPAYVDKP